jgi:hypothetical protein
MSFLTPHDRTELLESLRPPAGFKLHTAIATTYSLDLIALMVAPVGFTLFDIDPYGDEFSQRDPLELIEAVRRHAGQIVLFHEEGRIAVPQHYRPILTFLEGRIVAVRAPKPNRSFHPKLWIVRYVDDAEEVIYRLICLSRNLTFDRCWDTALILDGPLRAGRDKGFSVNAELRKFVAALPGMAPAGVSKEIASQVKLVEGEIGRVEWDLGALPFDEYAFWPLGFDGVSRWPFKERLERVVVVSPFLSDKALSKLTKGTEDSVLIARSEWLDKTSERALAGFTSVYQMADGVPTADVPDAEALPGSEAPLQGLHAKLYVADDGWNAHVWTGSANASTAAFEGNVEFLVQLVGKKSKVGVDVFLNKIKGTTSFLDLLRLYERPETPAVNEAQDALEKEIDDLRGPIASAGWSLTLVPGDEEDVWSAHATTGSKLPDWGKHVSVRCRPLSVTATTYEVKPGQKASQSFESLNLALLTSYLVVEVDATTKDAKASIRFLVNAELVGSPANRREKLLRHMLQDKKSVLRFLLLLLADISDDPATDLDSGKGKWRAGDWAAVESEALFEPLVRALDRSPGRLLAIKSLLQELSATPEGKDFIPDGFAELFEAVWAAREAEA